MTSLSDEDSPVYIGTYILNAGEYVDFDGPSHAPLKVDSTGAIQLVQFAKSYQSDNNRDSDPMMSLIPPTSQYTNRYTFSTIQSRAADPHEDEPFLNFLSLTIPFGSLPGMRLNHLPLETFHFYNSWNLTVDTRFHVIILNISTGGYIIENKDSTVTFGGLLYGFKLQESYGLPLGQKFKEFHYMCQRTSSLDGDIFDNDCDGLIDEELANGKDDDLDGAIDEDVNVDPNMIISVLARNYSSGVTPATEPQNESAIGMPFVTTNLPMTMTINGTDSVSPVQLNDTQSTELMEASTIGPTGETLQCQTIEKGEICTNIPDGNFDGRHIRTAHVVDQNLGVYWVETFWLWDGTLWNENGNMSESLRASNSSLCLMLLEQIWCINDGTFWALSRNVTGMPTHSVWDGNLSIYFTHTSWSWSVNGFMKSNKTDRDVKEWIGTTVGVDVSISDETFILAWNDTIWVWSSYGWMNYKYGNYGNYTAPSFSTFVLCRHATLWIWNGLKWIIEQISSKHLYSNTCTNMTQLSVLWFGNTWEWNSETLWTLRKTSERNTLVRNSDLPKDILFFINGTWWIFNGTAIWKSDLGHYFTEFFNGSYSFAIIVDGSYWVWQNGGWVRTRPQIDVSMEQLLMSRIAVSWSGMFWVHDAADEVWIGRPEYNEYTSSESTPIVLA